MIRMLHERERSERRAVGALRFIDATTGSPIDSRLTVSAPGAELTRNRSGLYVIHSWATLATHASRFDAPPAAPPIGSASLVCEVDDPLGRYLSRRVAVALPRDPDPQRADAADSLFRAIDVPMFASPTAPVTGNWVDLRVTVREPSTGDALHGVLLRVVGAAGVLARGLTDWRGEALVPVAGIPVTTWSAEPDAVVATEIAATLEACVAAGPDTRTPAAAVADGRQPHRRSRPDPDELERNRGALPRTTVPLRLATGRRLAVAISIALA